MNKVIQIANLVQDSKFNNPQYGRIYLPKGISPCIDTMGGGNREPKFLWIKPKDTSSDNPTTQGATSPITTLSHCGRALSPDAPETD